MVNAIRCFYTDNISVTKISTLECESSEILASSNSSSKSFSLILNNSRESAKPLKFYLF